MVKKITYEFVKEQFEKEKYKLLSKEYINAHTKLEYVCPQGHRHSIIWNSWQRGHRCPFCVGLGKPSIEFIKSEFEKEGYQLLTDRYINSRQKLVYICPEGHKHNITWSSWWFQKCRCPYCVGKAKPITEFIRSEFKKEGYELLTKEYVNSRQKLDYICPNGHKHDISWHDWQQGRRCYYCFGNIKPPIEFIKSEFAKEGYILLITEYVNSQQKLDYICPRGHKHNISWNRWKRGQRCPYCIGRISNEEVEVRNFIESLGIKISPNDRKQIFNPYTGNGFELDIFMLDFDKAVEYNGTYWHKDEGRDLLKQQLCRAKGIDLLTIWDKEWLNDNDKCKDKITEFIFN